MLPWINHKLSYISNSFLLEASVWLKITLYYVWISFFLHRSVVYQQSSKESATLQLFFTLQLDIQSDKIRTVQDALESLVARESVQGYTTKTKQEVCSLHPLFTAKCSTFNLKGFSQSSGFTELLEHTLTKEVRTFSLKCQLWNTARPVNSWV